jgi:predicted SAM-dependent methyltransferase
MMARSARDLVSTIRKLAASPTELRQAIGSHSRPAYRELIRRAAQRRLTSLPDGAYVHLGAGTVRWPGWLNVDIRRSVRPDIALDLRGGFPAPPSRVQFVYSEHLFEHLELGDAQRVLADLAVTLRQGGVVRIAMPDLDEIVDRYLNGWRAQAWLDDPDWAHIDSAAHMLNVSVREWGHKYLYNYDELATRMAAAGFSDVQRCAWGESDVVELRGRETRPDSKLVVEARIT